MSKQQNEQETLALFTLPVFLLPGGVTQLRIFEPRYIRMVKESAGDVGFALAYADKNSPNPTWAAWVQIIDFETRKDGLLGITVKAKKLVNLINIETEEDGLKKASVNVIEHWSEIENANNNFEHKLLSEQLERVFEQHPFVAELYVEPKLSDLHWVTARWLELLPISPVNYQDFIAASSFPNAQRFVKTVLLGDEK